MRQFIMLEAPKTRGWRLADHAVGRGWRVWPGRIAGALVAALLGCGSPPDVGPAAGEPSLVAPARAELRVDAEGLEPAEVDALIVEPVVDMLDSIAGVRHSVAESTEGRARIALTLDPEQELQAIDAFHAGASLLRARLPELAEPPRWTRVRAGTWLRWVIESDTLDLPALAELHAQLVERSWQLAGVDVVHGCAPQSRVVVELDVERLHAYGLDPGDVEAVLRGILIDQSLPRPEQGIEVLRELVVGLVGGVPVRLGDLAGLRYGYAKPECVAATVHGIAASTTVTLADAEARAALETMLDDAAGQLPPGISLSRFGPGHVVVDLSLTPGLSTEQAAEAIGRSLVRAPGRWLVEVGVPAAACVGLGVGAGMQARLSIEDVQDDAAGLLTDLRALPEVALAEREGDPALHRVFVFADDPQQLRTLVDEQVKTLGALPHVVRVGAHVEVPSTELRIELDRAAIAALGLTADELSRALRWAIGGVELGRLGIGDRAVPLILSTAHGDAPEPDPEQLGAMIVRRGEPDITLAQVAKLGPGAGPSRLCRVDHRRGVMLTVEIDEPRAWALLRPWIEAALPPGAWTWMPE